MITQGYINTDFDFKQIVGIEEKLSTSVYTNSENEVNLLVDLNYKNPATRSFEFKELITKYSPLLSSDFLSLGQDIQQIYMGSLNLDVSIHFNHDALKNFFNLSDLELCIQYASFTEKNDNCQNNLYEDKTIVLYQGKLVNLDFNPNRILGEKHKYFDIQAEFWVEREHINILVSNP